MTSSDHRVLDPVGPGSFERARELHTIPNRTHPELQPSTLLPPRLSPAIRRPVNSNTSINGETLSRLANSRPERLALSLQRHGQSTIFSIDAYQSFRRVFRHAADSAAREHRRLLMVEANVKEISATNGKRTNR